MLRQLWLVLLSALWLLPVAAVQGQTAMSATLYDRDGVSVIATETQDALEFAVSEPDSIFVSIEVDRNQNGQFDRLVDVAYRPQASENVCPQSLIDSQHNTPCGGFASSAYLRNFKDEGGRRHFVLVLPKKEISFDLPSARLAFVIRDNAQRKTSYYPPERFQKAINIPYLIDQVGAASNTEDFDGEVSKPTVNLPSVSYQISTDGADLSIESGLGDHENASDVVYKVGGGVSPPLLQQKVLANYSDEALRARYQGVCLIEMIVDAQGKVQNPRVIRPLGMGLDEKALQAIRNWKFKPAMKDGKTPVPVMITVEVGFHLYTPAQNIASAQPSQNGPSPKRSPSNSPPSVTDAMENHSQSVSEASAPTGPCAGPEGIATVPTQVLDDLRLATKMPNPHEASKKAIEIASQPGSGLKVAYLLKDADGTIILYTIVVASAPKCAVATMVFHREQGLHPQRILPAPAVPRQN